MRPQPGLRAPAALALGTLGIAIPLAAGPDAARSDTTTGTITTTSPGATATAARVADFVPGRRRLNVVSGRCALVSGRIEPRVAGRRVVLQRQTGHGWRTIDRATTRAGGAYVFRFRPRRPGSARVRVRAGASRERIGRLNVYRRAFVSWYGPGLFGGRLGCGGTLTPGTVGVAHRTLPCGTRLTLRHGGRILRVRVIDRGPYVGGREYDLTAATKHRLRFGGVGSILTTR